MEIFSIYDISNFLLTFWIYTVIIVGTLHPFLLELYKELYMGIIQTNTLYTNFYDKELTFTNFYKLSNIASIV